MKVKFEAVAKKNKKSDNTISENRKARFDFEISKKYEAGLSLLGWETKSISCLLYTSPSPRDS